MEPSTQSVAVRDEDPSKIGVYLLIDQAIVRAGIRRMLELRSGIRVLGEAEAPRGKVTSIVRSFADVVVCGAYREAPSGDFSWLEALKRHVPDCRVLLLAEYPGEPTPRWAFAHGVDGMIPTNAEPRELLLAIDAIRRGYPWLSPALAGDRDPAKRGDERSER